MILVYLAIILVCLMTEGFFAGTEMAVISSNKFKLRYLANKGHKGAQKINRLMKKPQLFLATTLVGVNLSIIISSAVATHALSHFLPEKLVNITATAVMLPLILFFGEIVPMTLGRTYSTKLSLILITPLYMAHYLLYPLVRTFSWISEKIVMLLNVDIKKKDFYVTREELVHILEEETKDKIEHDHEDGIIKKIFHFQNILVEQIMVPLKDAVSVEGNICCETVINIMQRSGFSRIPVYEKNLHNIIGIVRPSELILAQLEKPVKEYLSKPYRVYQKTPLIVILWELQLNGIQMVIVEDLKGNALGLVTLEDIMEKVVGSIKDEYDALRKE